MNYCVSERIGFNGITIEDGQRVYDGIAPHLHNHRSVTLDFAGMNILTSPFLNTAIGQLLRDMTVDELNHYLIFKNVPAPTQPILKHIIQNASAYYGDALVRQAIGQVLQKEAGEADGI